MSKRYRVHDGIVLRRTELPSGDVVVTLLSEDGKWRAVARKGKLVGGNLGKLSLFHDVTVQHYRRRDEDLPLITQVQLNGALPRLSGPDIYPYAHVLAELTDKLTVDVHVGERIYGYFASALRGLSQHPDPEAVALVMCWRLLGQAGLAPRLTRCARCGEREVVASFDPAAGGLTCAACGSGFRLPLEVADELAELHRLPVRGALELPLTERRVHWTVLGRYLSYHVGELWSLNNLKRGAPDPVSA